MDRTESVSPTFTSGLKSFLAIPANLPQMSTLLNLGCQWMERYRVTELLGEGSYGKVLKAVHIESGTEVAIKKFIETEEDSAARKVALREIRMLKKLHHPNLVRLLEVFRRKKRFHLVFEYMDCSLLQEMESHGKLPESMVRKYMYQILRGVDYCHSHNIIHRDLKPENILISDLGIVKICDFGFARFATVINEPFTDYVATRWYRAPELLVAEPNYGRGVDIWALGCIQLEMLTGQPLFPGDSDMDQLYKITKLLGGLSESQKVLMARHSEKGEGGCEEMIYSIKTQPKFDPHSALRERFPYLEMRTTDFAASCLRLDPDGRARSEQLLGHSYFSPELFLSSYLPQLEERIQEETLRRRLPITDLPCPILDFSQPSLPYTRRSSRTNVGWTFNIPNESAMMESRSSFIDWKSLDRSTLAIENEKYIEASSSQLKLSTVESLDWRDLELTSEIPKVSLGFKRNMMPGTQTYLRPIGGQLYYDKLLTLPCHSGTIERQQDDGIYLPLIKMSSKTYSENTNAIHDQLKRTKNLQREKNQAKSTKDGQKEVFVSLDEEK